MDNVFPGWCNSLIVALCVALLAACEVLGYNSPAQSAAEQDNSNHATNTANNNPLMGNHDNGASTAGNPKVTVSAAPVSDKGFDCSRYMSGHTYYLQSADGKQKVEQVKVGATGYGAPPKSFYPEAQRRLMTIRASKVDAYRALTEVVGGLHIWGGSAIGNMVIEHDRYRTFIDTYVRGARVISVAPMADGTYKTEVEMSVDQAFLSRVMAFTDPTVDRRCLDQFAHDTKGSYAYYGGESAGSNFYYSE
jgi:hypothetical protein